MSDSRPAPAGAAAERDAVTAASAPGKPGAPDAFPPVQRSLTASSGRPYSAFSQQTKWAIALLGGLAAVCSPISSNIFVPAIPVLASDFGRSTEDISLGVTVYLVFQAVTPSFFGSLSDTYGRRPIYMATMIVYIGANIGLALMPTSAYWLLLVLRALQATGGSAVISIGAGAVADVAEPRERGKFMSVFQCGAMIGPALGPFLGGVFAQTLGWRAIFWFLTILAGVVLVVMFFLFPETLRSIVGDGSIPPPALNSSPAALLQRRRMERERKAQGLEKVHVERPPRKPYQPLSAFIILFTPEIILLFFFVSLVYLQFYCVLTLTSTALEDQYGFNELIIGLCYLPSGAGTITASLINGRQIDHYYRKEEARVGGDYRKKPDEFRIELARIRCIFPFLAIFLVGSIAYGWCLQVTAPLAATLVVQFFVGLGSGMINIATVYGQDIMPGKGGAVSASLNLVRCAFGAVGTAVIQIMYERLGAGWTLVLLSGITLAGFPLALLVIARAKHWRAYRQSHVSEGSRLARILGFAEERREAEKQRGEAERADGLAGEGEGEGTEGVGEGAGVRAAREKGEAERERSVQVVDVDDDDRIVGVHTGADAARIEAGADGGLEGYRAPRRGSASDVSGTETVVEGDLGKRADGGV